MGNVHGAVQSLNVYSILDRTQGDMSSLKKQLNACNMYTDWEGIMSACLCLSVSVSSGMVSFIRYVFSAT